MNKIKKVLFICSGNTCRSPFAEYYARWLKKTKYQKELKDVEFDSAGLYHYFDKPQDGTVKYLNSKGIDIGDFKAKVVDSQLLKQQDLILGFEKKFHINKLLRKFKEIPKLDEKLTLLLKFVGEKKELEIIDPFDLPNKEYHKILEKIEHAVDKAIIKIIEINKKKK